MAETPETISPSGLTIIESSEFSHANADGTITVPANDEEVLVEIEPSTFGNAAVLHALGAADAKNVRYQLKYNSTNIAYETEAPLGTLTNAFSFTDNLGRPIKVEGTMKYVAVNSGDSAVNLAARFHTEVF